MSASRALKSRRIIKDNPTHRDFTDAGKNLQTKTVANMILQAKD